MKKHFGEYRFEILKAAKHFGLTLTETRNFLMRQLTGDIDVTLDFSANLTDKDYEVFQLASEFQCLTDPGTHFFIESEELAAALPYMVKSYDPSMLDALFEEEDLKVGVIHTCGQEAKGVLFSIFRTPAGSCGIFYRCSSTGHIGHMFRGAKGAKSYPKSDLSRLLIGLGLYLKCFPHALKPGFPESAKHPAHYKGSTCAGVTAVPEIIERSGVTPHFRAGHFRVLQHERYTKKRYQVVFVRETFVKGRVKTVEDVRDELDGGNKS